MSFRSASEAQESAEWARSGEDHESTSQPQGAGPSAEDSEQRFGMEMYRDGLETKVQRLVDSHGPDRVQRWADEGMPVETMGKPHDMESFRERQADRPEQVPTDIERQNAKSVQRSKGAHNEASNAGDAGVPDSVREVVSSPGQQLDTSVQRAVEERMGDSLGDVRIHTGPSAASACDDINARAFTVGNHIAFNAGEYDPESPEGQHVLAHELAHVRQQTGGAVSMLPQKGKLEIDPDERLEREAEETAQRVMQGGELGIYRMAKSEVHVQRAADDGWNQAPDTSEKLYGPEGITSEDVSIPKDLDSIHTAVETLYYQMEGVKEELRSQQSIVQSALGEGTKTSAAPAAAGTATSGPLGGLIAGGVGFLAGSAKEFIEQLRDGGYKDALQPNERFVDRDGSDTGGDNPGR